MDEFDKLLNEGVFGQQSHVHRFVNGETQAEREEWLRSVNANAKCQAANVQYVVRETTHEGHLAYELGFPDANQLAAFTITIFGDDRNPDAFGHTQEFVNHGPEYQEAFLLAADAHLTALGIECHAEQQAGQMRFGFDRFSEKHIFQTLVDEGIIDASAKAIVRARDLQRRLQSGPVQGSTGTHLNLD